MRLAVFTNSYPGRTTTFFERDMRSLLDAGIDIEIFAIRPLDADHWRYSLALLDESRLPRDRVHHLTAQETLAGLASIPRGRTGRALLDAGAAVGSALRHGALSTVKTAYVMPKAWAWARKHGSRFDHILGYWGNYPATCAYAFHRLMDRPVPFSLWLHAGIDLYEGSVLMRQKLLYADNIVTCCDFNRTFILDRYPDLAERVAPRLHVCHHGLDVGAFTFQPEGRPARHMIAVGRLVPKKGFDDLLLAAQLLQARGVDFQLDFIGDGEERENLQHRAQQLGIGGRVRFRGWMKFEDVRNAMAETTLLVHPSDGLGDGLPNVIREAMAVGTPVVASSVAGIPDALGDGCGILTPPKQPAALAAAIEAAFAAPETLRQIAQRARQRVEERYDMKRNGAVLAERLLRTTRDSRPAPERRPAELSGALRKA